MFINVRIRGEDETVHDGWLSPMVTHEQFQLEALEIQGRLILTVSKLQIIANTTHPLKRLFLTLDSLDKVSVFYSMISRNRNLESVGMYTAKDRDVRKAFVLVEETASKFTKCNKLLYFELQFGNEEETR